ncbi:MAG TPA: peptidoglycan-associated lipoprotein Pal [Syntrophales bacterium]|nr:peptidoglycan-associated lipoprotein Pal [Syntrophales bacterium]HRT61556.1 peptidoglycan-associated lipoprotein Pal [Syntrophales bacterium]
MEKKAFRWIAVLLFLAVAAGCAEKKAYAPVDVMPNVRAAGQVQCIDNFVVLFDRSDSMNAFYQPAGMSRLAFEKKTVSEMVDTIPPDIKLNGALRFFGAEKVGGDETTWLVLGRTSFNKAEFQAALEKNVKRGLGRTPIGRALAGAGGDLKGAVGKSAIILFSDFEEVEGIDDIRPKSVMENVAKLKADYGDNLCIYPVQIGKDPVGKKLAEQIVADAGCGFVENADNLTTPAAMAAYVQKVFFCAPTSAAPAEKPAAMVPPPMVPGVDKLDAIYFDFDKYDLRSESRATLKKNADWLTRNPDRKVVIEGNCDERGTNEYNMALGQRRAEAAAKYLNTLGVSAGRILTISYGEDRPVCKESTEECWARNRRDDFILK